MSKAKIAAVFILGMIVGIMATIKLFAIKDVDFLSLPYKNQGVVLKEDVALRQNGINISLPKGSEVNLTYHMPEGIGIFSIPVRFEFGQEPQLSTLARRATYFNSVTSASSSTKTK